MIHSLTVGIITFNEENSIKRCLESLLQLKSSVPDLSIIVVDNNSSDKTIHEADQTLKSTGITYQIVQRTENNLAAARNDIFRHSRNRWVYMMDADCCLDITTWDNLIQNWKNESQFAAWGGSQKFFNDYEILVLLDEMRRTYWGHFGSAQMLAETANSCVEHLSTTHVLYDKQRVESVGGFNEKLSRAAEDLDLSLRLRKAGYDLHFNPLSFVWHEQVQSWREWRQKAFRNGVWQTRLIAYNLDILKTRRPWPGIFLLLMLFLFPIIFVPLAGLYCLILSYTVMHSQLRGKARFQLWVLLATTHFLYALGEVLGIFLALWDWVRDRKLPVSTNT